MKPIIGITLGDIAGIGPEVVAKALAHTKVWTWCEPWVYGPPGVLSFISQELGLGIKEVFFGPSRRGKVLVRPVGKVSSHGVSCAKMRPELAKIAMDCVHAATKDILAGKIHALVTSPIHKRGVRTGIPFVGHTEFLANLTGVKDVVMMMTSSKLRVALVTTHVSLREVAKEITRERVLKVIRYFDRALKRFGIKRPKIGVASLNPHGGEDGGFEELKVIRPAVLQARRRGIRAEGPISADALFYQAYEGFYDGVVAMYHDQGLSPLKMIYFDKGVNVTLGLPFVRTSPDHGTAYDIAGKNRANPGSMIEAIRVAVQMIRNRRWNMLGFSRRS